MSYFTILLLKAILNRTIRLVLLAFVIAYWSELKVNSLMHARHMCAPVSLSLSLFFVRHNYESNNKYLILFKYLPIPHIVCIIYFLLLISLHFSSDSEEFYFKVHIPLN